MKLIASLLASAALSLATASSFAAPINPVNDGYGITVGNTVLTSANTTLDLLKGVYSFSDGTSTFTFVEVNAAPLVSALSITRTCITLGILGGPGCSAETVSVSNASILNGAIQASALVGVSLNAGAQANIGNLVFAQSNLGLAAETAIVGYPAAPTGNSPVPEPGSLALLATGLVGAAGSLRKKFLA